jgi:hypothetical protein
MAGVMARHLPVSDGTLAGMPGVGTRVGCGRGPSKFFEGATASRRRRSGASGQHHPDARSVKPSECTRVCGIDCVRTRPRTQTDAGPSLIWFRRRTSTPGESVAKPPTRTVILREAPPEGPAPELDAGPFRARPGTAEFAVATIPSFLPGDGPVPFAVFQARPVHRVSFPEVAERGVYLQAPNAFPDDFLLVVGPIRLRELDIHL